VSDVREVLVDTDVLSAVMRRHPSATERSRTYLERRRHFTFSVITRYEILRGLYAKGASKQLVAFEQLCAVSIVLPITDETITQAARIYADLHQRGRLIGDADILIAACAMEHGLGIATNNEVHFRRVRNLPVENWLS
jgi:tRNA(fMet)-specific endonuclease VapC